MCYFIGNDTPSDGDFLNSVDSARDSLPHRRFRAQTAKRTFYDSETFLLWILHAQPL